MRSDQYKIRLSDFARWQSCRPLRLITAKDLRQIASQATGQACIEFGVVGPEKIARSSANRSWAAVAEATAAE